MKLHGGLGHLTYCLNVHPTQTWAECRAALLGPVAEVRRALCPDRRAADVVQPQASDDFGWTGSERHGRGGARGVSGVGRGFTPPADDGGVKPRPTAIRPRLRTDRAETAPNPSPPGSTGRSPSADATPSSSGLTGRSPRAQRDAPVGPGHDGYPTAEPGFAVGLRFSAQAVQDLSDLAARADLAEILADNAYLPVTVNGFPYGPFHGTRVKEEVYQPDWTRPERLAYTTALADLMAALNPAGAFVSLSTVPGTFKPLAQGREAEMAGNMLKAAAHLHGLRERTGVTVALAIEPEPFCFLETIDEAVAFFDRHLFSETAAATLARLTGLPRAEAAAALPRHLGLCYDVCHAAVEYEDPAGSIAALRAAGIPVHKLQLSAALRVPALDAAARHRLAAFDEPTYLHQVVSRRNGRLRREPDLPPALARPDSDGEEWRVHFHVPLFVDRVPPFATTQDFLAEILALHRARPIAPHLEVETYTWSVLPPDLRGASLADDIARELAWVLERLA